MKIYDFKSYHIRGMNAETEEEKQAINQELKDLYERLPSEEKAEFNEQLQKFLIKEVATIKSVYDATQADGSN